MKWYQHPEVGATLNRKHDGPCKYILMMHPESALEPMQITTTCSGTHCRRTLQMHDTVPRLENSIRDAIL